MLRQGDLDRASQHAIHIAEALILLCGLTLAIIFVVLSVITG